MTSLLIRDSTPVETYGGILVKREDLCSPYPGPGFAKIRGVLAHIRARPESVVGVLDTFHSKGGWAVAACCAELGKRCIDYYPRYREDKDGELRRPQEEARRLGAEIVPLAAGRSAVLYHAAKRDLAHREEGWGRYMMPNALKLPETVEEVAREVERTRAAFVGVEHVVISVSSGTIAAGVVRGLERVGRYPELWLHLGYDRSEEELHKYLASYVPAHRSRTGMARILWPKAVHVVNEKWAYKEAAGGSAPFPCNPHYDLKAWRWLCAQREAGAMRGRVLFWNVGE